MKNSSIGFVAVLMAFTFHGVAEAQLNNKPFSFKTPDGGVGMSAGGMQAILNEKVLGVSPRNMVRGTDGQLLDVSKGPGGYAIVNSQGGESFPTFKGTSFRGDNAAMAASVFNSYFVPGHSGSSGGGYGQIPSGAVVSTWTGRVVSGAGVSYSPASSVDNWTGMVY